MNAMVILHATLSFKMFVLRLWHLHLSRPEPFVILDFLAKAE